MKVCNLSLKYGSFLLTLFFFIQCTGPVNETDTVIARVNDKKLMQSELEKVIPGDISAADSAVMADDYIRKWVRQELVIQKANENLSPEQKDVSRELEEYRNALIIYKYKNELMKQRMDTTVTRQQIEEYYNANPGNFNLNRNIVKAVFIKIPLESANPALLKSMALNTTDEGLNELREYCLRYAKSFDNFSGNWVSFDIVKNNVPVEIEDPERFLKTKSIIEARDAGYYYLVNIIDYRLKNELAPLDFVEEEIKSLILNQRKIEFLKEVEENIYQEGVRQNKFMIYNNKR